MKIIAAAGNTVVPAILALEHLGFEVRIQQVGSNEECVAARGEEIYIANDPVCTLGLIKLVENRGWDWRAEDAEIEAILQRFWPGMTNSR